VCTLDEKNWHFLDVFFFSLQRIPRKALVNNNDPEVAQLGESFHIVDLPSSFSPLP
jgi:hypothetical protein